MSPVPAESRASRSYIAAFCTDSPFSTGPSRGRARSAGNFPEIRHQRFCGQELGEVVRRLQQHHLHRAVRINASRDRSAQTGAAASASLRPTSPSQRLCVGPLQRHGLTAAALRVALQQKPKTGSESSSDGKTQTQHHHWDHTADRPIRAQQIKSI